MDKEERKKYKESIAKQIYNLKIEIQCLDARREMLIDLMNHYLEVLTKNLKNGDK